MNPWAELPDVTDTTMPATPKRLSLCGLSGITVLASELNTQ
jgi:hypothetical protein